ncbi:hypothetical protein KAX02_09055 [candidate division WOR-3 bacterium]|nr:hypothetical protein [candidate division WOR-3 bacterium]
MLELVISFFQKLSNREAAVAIWILVALIWVLSQHKIRKYFFLVIKAFFAWKLAISYLLMFSYIALMLLLLHSLGIWRLTHFTNTVLWFVCVAFVMLFEYSKTNDESFFKNAIKDNLKILIILEFLINLYIFSLWIELLLVPFFFILGGMIAIAETDKKYEIVQKFLNYVMAIVGVVFTSYALYMVAFDFKKFVTLENFENFFLPILLTIMFLPFIYFVALYASYETLFLRFSFFVKDSSLLSYVKKKTLFAFGLNLWNLNKWAKHINTLRFMDEKGVDEAIRAFKSATP